MTRPPEKPKASGTPAKLMASMISVFSTVTPLSPNGSFQASVMAASKERPCVPMAMSEVKSRVCWCLPEPMVAARSQPTPTSKPVEPPICTNEQGGRRGEEKGTNTPSGGTTCASNTGGGTVATPEHVRP